MLHKEIKELQKSVNLDNFLPQDRFRLEKWLKKLSKLNDEKQLRHQLEKLKKVFNTLHLKKEKHSYKPEIKYPNDLPISAKVDEIKKLIEDNQVIIVSGATGSGKTTQIPKILLDMGFAENGIIGCTQPRRIAATGMAKRVAYETGCSYGKEVGCQIRFDRSVTDDTLVKFMTDGILLSETVKDKLLLQYSALIIDEVHERSLNIDFILGYIKRLLKRRKELKVVISSATLDAGGFSKFFDDAPVVKVEGKVFPIEDIYLPPYEDEELSQHCVRAIDWITELDPHGDVLIFMPGEREIRDAVDLLKGKKYKNTSILALYGRISIAEQNQIFDKGSSRRIIISTNVAETSITIPGIHYVVDSGLARVNRYNPKTQIQMLQVEQISKASAKQRRGRCGRITEGVCVYLYDKDVMEKASDYTDPEICRTSLSGVILQMKTLNLPDIEEFPFLDMPSVSLIREGKKGLREILALDKQNDLTNEGYDISKFPIEPRFAKMICEANRLKVLPEVLSVVAYLSLQDPRERPETKKMAADQAHAKLKNEKSDFLSILSLWNYLSNEFKNGASNSKLRKICAANFLNYRRIREWFNLYQDLGRIVNELKWEKVIKIVPFYNINEDYVHMSILSGFPMNIGQKKEGNFYQSTQNRKFYIFPGSGVFKTLPEWIMGFPFVETSRLFGRNIAEINTEWLNEIAPHLCKTKYYDIHWDSGKGFVFALESVTFAGIEVKSGKRVHYGNINRELTRKIFIREGMVEGNMFLRNSWIKRHRKLIKNIEYQEIKRRMPEALLDKESVYEHFNNIIPDDIFSAKSLDRWLYKSKNNIDIKIENAVYPQLHGFTPKDYPEFISLNNEKFMIRYKYCPGEEMDGVTVYVPESKLLFIPEWLPDWIVPGWLPDKIERLIKSLPKNIKINLFPIKNVIDRFCKKIETVDLYKNNFLVLSLIEFIRREYDINCGVDDFDIDSLPDFLTLNVAVIDEKTKKIKNLSRGFEGVERESLNDFYASVVGIEKWTRSGLVDWPDFDIPESIVLDETNDMKGYPALICEDDSIGVKVFLEEEEAYFSHKLGLAKLFRIHFSDQCKFIEKKINLSRNSILSLSSIYHSNNYKSEIIDSAIGKLITDRGFRFVRSAAEFEKQCECVLGNLFKEIESQCINLARIFKEKDEIENLLFRQSINVYDEIINDIKDQFEILLSQGFLKYDLIYIRYLKYFQGLKVRVQRLGFNKEKDFNKFIEIQKYQNALNEYMQNNKNIFSSYCVIESLFLLQEYRIKVFAPELKPFKSVTLNKLEEKFKKILLSVK